VARSEIREGDLVPTYVSLLNYTDQGIRSVKGSPERQQQAEQRLQQLGGRFIGHYLTMGAYDYVLVWEAPDDETAARFMLTVGSAGNVRTTTLKAFPQDRFPDILRSVG
jgi:uncharacterized protein with GYD domain